MTISAEKNYDVIIIGAGRQGMWRLFEVRNWV